MSPPPPATPTVHRLHPHTDARGHFLPALFRADDLADDGLIHLSHSHAGVLRGMHFQSPTPQAKCLHVLSGSIFDVAVDLRRSSPHFGKFHSFHLSAREPGLLKIPAGFAHGFLALEYSLILYSVDAPYEPAHEWTLAWDDPDLAIPWPAVPTILSPRDVAAVRLRDLPPHAFHP